MIKFIKFSKTKYIFTLLFSLTLACSSGGGGNENPINNDDTTAPSTPQNLANTNTTKTSTDLSWEASTDNVGVQTYLIFQDGSSLTSNNSTSRTIVGLSPGTSYEYKVQAKDAAGNLSGFSNTITVSTESNDAALQIASGNLETYIGDFIDNVPGASGDSYQVPTTNELNTWDETVDAILANNITLAVEKSALLNYQITEFTDITFSPSQVFYILEEQSTTVNHWGTYIFSKTPVKENLIIQAPHIKYDINTGKQAIYCFKNNLAKAVFISGAHRCNNSGFSSCSGTTSACGSNESYRVSDLAHNTQSVFQKSTEILFNSVANSVFVQIHGFGKQASDPYVIMSNGTRETPTTDYVVLLRDALLAEDNTLTFKIAHIDKDWTRLIGFTNTQGRLINNSANHCTSSATSTSGRFIHIEQEKTKLRDDVSGWNKLSNALKSCF